MWVHKPNILSPHCTHAFCNGAVAADSVPGGGVPGQLSDRRPRGRRKNTHQVLTPSITTWHKQVDLLRCYSFKSKVAGFSRNFRHIVMAGEGLVLSSGNTVTLYVRQCDTTANGVRLG